MSCGCVRRYRSQTPRAEPVILKLAKSQDKWILQLTKTPEVDKVISNLCSPQEKPPLGCFGNFSLRQQRKDFSVHFEYSALAKTTKHSLFRVARS